MAINSALDVSISSLANASRGINRVAADIARTGVDYISCGDLTKGVEPLDLSMRFLLDQ